MKKIFSPDKLLLMFVLISAFVSFFYLFKAFQDIGLNVRLDMRAEANITRWQIEEDGKGSKFIIGAFYEYFLDGVKHEGRTIFNDINFLNYSAALDGVKELSNKKLLASYSSKDVDFSKLDYRFKIKNSVYSFVSLGVLFYFLALRKRMKKFEC